MSDQGAPYDFQISRNPVGDGQTDGAIPLDDWERLIAADASLEPVAHVWGRDPRTGERIQVPLVGGAKWTGHPDGIPLPFRWHHGKVVGHSVDGITLAKARDLAAALNAECIVSVD